MGIWSRFEKDANSEVIRDTERILSTHYSADAKEFLNRFLYLKTHPDNRVIEPFSLYATALNILILSASVPPEKYNEYMMEEEREWKEFLKEIGEDEDDG